MTGRGALAFVQAQEAKLTARRRRSKAPVGELETRIAQLMDSARATEKELARLKSKAAASAGDDLAGSAVDVKGAKVLAAALDGADAKTLRETMDKLKDKLKSAAIVLASVTDGKVTLIAGVTSDLTAKVKAGELVNHVAQQVGGKGGGRPDMAQAGGTDPAGLAGGAASRCRPSSNSGCDRRDLPMNGPVPQSPQFASDNWSGICPEAWAALAAANAGHAPSYGGDDWTAAAREGDPRGVRDRLRGLLRVQRHGGEFARALRDCAAAPTRSSATRTRTSTSTNAARRDFFSGGAKLLTADTPRREAHRRGASSVSR